LLLIQFKDWRFTDEKVKKVEIIFLQNSPQFPKKNIVFRWVPGRRPFLGAFAKISKSDY